MDTDMACLGDLTELLHGQDAHFAQQRLFPKPGDVQAIGNGFMAAPRRHPFFAFLVDELKQPSSGRGHPVEATGPAFLTRALWKWHRAGGEAARALAACNRTSRHEAMGFCYAMQTNSMHGLRVHRVPVITGDMGQRPACGNGSRQELCACMASTSMRGVVTTSFWTHSWVDRWVAEGEPGHAVCRVCGNLTRKQYFRSKGRPSTRSARTTTR